MVALAAKHRVPLVPQGGNTGMVAGATPPADGSALLLSLRRMNRIRSIDAGSRIAIAEAGVILETLHDAAAEQGLRFPLTLGARGSCTIGGLAATNAGGTQVLRFGTMRALVAGVEAVLPDGAIHDGLSGLKKDNRGYSLDQLLIGSEGTLGVITAAALRLVPAAAERCVAWAGPRARDRRFGCFASSRPAPTRSRGSSWCPTIRSHSSCAISPAPASPLAGTHGWHVLIEASSARLRKRARRDDRGAARRGDGRGADRRRRHRRQRGAGRGLLEASRLHFGGRARRGSDPRA